MKAQLFIEQDLVDRVGVMAVCLGRRGIINCINKQGAKLLGGDYKELRGMSWLDNFIRPEDRSVVQNTLIRVMSGGGDGVASYSENIVLTLDDEERLVGWHNTVIKDSDNLVIGVFSTGIDITEQRLIEEKLRGSEDRYKMIFERSPVALLNYDTNLIVTDCNDRLVVPLEISREKLIGLDICTIDDNSFVPALEDALAGQEGKYEGYYKATFSGKLFWIIMRTAPIYDNHGDISGGIAMIEDLTVQKQAAKDKELLLSAMEQSSEAMIITDTRPGINYVNSAFERLTGYSAAEVMGKDPKILKSDEHPQEFYAKMWRTLAKGEVWRGRIVNKRKDGELFEEVATISPVRNEEGAVANFIAVKRDITREAELEKQLFQAQKMEAIGTLAGGIAHDFNNILAAVLGYAEIIDAQLVPESPLKPDIEQIIIAGNRGAELVKQILAFSRKVDDSTKPVKVQSVIKEALKLLSASMPATIEIEEDIRQDCGQVLVDPISVHQVMMNLCTNAHQAMGEDRGVLRVGLREIYIDENEPGKLSPLLSDGRWLVLEVGDSGCGMTGKEQKRVFEPFFTTKEPRQGTGLGLSVVHGIVKKYGGEITLSSRLGEGTVFHIYLPVIDDEQSKETETHVYGLPRGVERILVVDDEPLLADIVEKTLTALGYRVTGFTDSEEALAAFYRETGSFDMVIADMTMPHMTGIEFARKVLARRPDLPVIICTEYSELIDEGHALTAGIEEILHKPVDGRALAETVRWVLDG